MAIIRQNQSGNGVTTDTAITPIVTVAIPNNTVAVITATIVEVSTGLPPQRYDRDWVVVHTDGVMARLGRPIPGVDVYRQTIGKVTLDTETLGAAQVMVTGDGSYTRWIIIYTVIQESI